MNDYVAIEDERFTELEEQIKASLPQVNLKRVRKAYDFAREAHDGQFRMSGVPYICHPIEVAKILADLQVDEETLISALLHDVPEDTKYEVEDVEERFGSEVSNIVDGLTKLSKVYYKHSMGERQVQSLRKMFIQTAKDPRVVFVKLADRLHNMSTLKYLRPDKQQRIAKESLEIYAPLANLYGMYELRRKMEDLCFRYLQPEAYARIEAYVQDHDIKRSRFIKDTIRLIKKQLEDAGIEADVNGRHKHLYSIYQKMLRDQRKLKDIYDYFAIRILTKDVSSCYQALGVIHDTFKPKAKRFKDYIAIPKSNGYRSLHSTVVGLKGQLVEVQIRTEDMHREAEYGAASHLNYKNTDFKNLFAGIENLSKYKNPESFIQGLQDDVLQDKIYVFSPQGEIINLPEGATPLDYIYALKLPVNSTHFKALVNRRNYSLIGELQNGDHVEILYGQKKRQGPERWWLEHVKTTKAKNSIQRFFKRKSFSEKIMIGRKLLQRELDHENNPLVDALPKAVRRRAKTRFELDSFDKVLASIGSGHLSAKVVYQAMFPEVEVSVYYKVWNWLRHRFSATHEFDEKFRIRILIEAYDRVGLLADILKPLYEMKIPIMGIYGTGYDIKRRGLFLNREGESVDFNQRYVGRDWIDIHVTSHEQLVSLFDRIEQVPGVIRVQRVFRTRKIKFYLMSTLTLIWLAVHPFVLSSIAKNHPSDLEWLNKVWLYAGFSGIFVLLLLVRNTAQQTFPHLGETRLFWPLSFGLSALGVAIVIYEERKFGLNLDGPVLIGLGAVFIAHLLYIYYQDRVRSRQHLNLLKASHKDRDGTV